MIPLFMLQPIVFISPSPNRRQIIILLLIDHLRLSRYRPPLRLPTHRPSVQVISHRARTHHPASPCSFKPLLSLLHENILLHLFFIVASGHVFDLMRIDGSGPPQIRRTNNLLTLHVFFRDRLDARLGSRTARHHMIVLTGDLPSWLTHSIFSRRQ